MPMETMARYEQLRSVKTKGKMKGLSHSKARRKKQEREHLRNNMDSICKYCKWGDVTNTLQNADEKYKEKCSTFFSGQEVDEFIVVDQERWNTALISVMSKPVKQKLKLHVSR